MIGKKQKIVSNKNGDCFRACVASILELNNNSKLPNKHGGDWFCSWFKFFESKGLSLSWDKDMIWKSGYWIAVVPSKNYKNTNHSIVMLGNKVAFDPSTKKTYRKGISLLGRKIVKLGYWIELSDISKFKNYLKT